MKASDYTDLQIQFRMAKQRSDDGLRSTHDVVATIDGAGAWRGEATIDATTLGAAEGDVADYARELGSLLLRPAIMNAFRQARGINNRPVRVRLLLEMGANGERESQHALRWERASVTLNGRALPLATTPDLPFSRYVATESVDPDLSEDAVLRLLVVFANPTALPGELQPIDVEGDLSKLLDELTPLLQTNRFKLSLMTGRTGCSAAMRERLQALGAEIVDGPARVESVADAIRQCQGLHLVAHGTMNPSTKRGALLLENEQGGRAFVFDEDLHAWMHPGLRFVVLQSCQTAAPTPPDGPPFVGIGPRLVQLGVPAVVAMQDFVAMDDARVFAAAFYSALMRDGVVDAAVNTARQAIFHKTQNDSYSIPVLFMRLRHGLLWLPDRLRVAVQARLAELERRPQRALPLRAVLSLHRTLDYDPATGPPGALFDMPMKLAEVCTTPEACVLIIGPRGMSKGTQLAAVYREAATRFLEDAPGAPAPVLLTARAILDARSVDAAISSSLDTSTSSASTAAWSNRPLLLIVEADEEIGDDALREALWLVKDFQQRARQRVLCSLDEGARQLWNAELEPSAVLVARPMEFERVVQFLKKLGTPESDHLCEVVEQRQCRDVAGTPWLLERMISLSQRKVTFDSRATLLRQIANECLTSIPLGGVPRQCAERALEQIAWRLQCGRETTLGGSDLFDILARARGNREFRLSELQDILVRSGVMATSGEDAVRFRYQSLQAYYAAQHLVRMPEPERQRMLEDITASLGRLSRARWWEKTLVSLSGLDPRGREGILAAILAGSTLVEGDQVYIAARCYIDTRDPKQQPPELVNQIADALIWRSHPGNLRPYVDRKRAALALAELRHPNAVPHLVSLACDQLATSWGSGKRYELSGLRLIATNGLVLMRDEASEYVRTHRPQLATVLNAWWTAFQNGNLDELIAELQRNDAATSPIAAFALGLFAVDAALCPLITAFADPQTDRDVGWAIADTFASLDPAWVSQHVIEPRLDQFDDPRVPYLVGRAGMTSERLVPLDYLRACIARGNPAVQARALRALALLKDATVRPLCEAVVLSDWAAARTLGLTVPDVLADEDLNRLRNASIESLRDVGTAESIATLRKARLGAGMTMTLRQLSFDVAEDIYWQLTGGLSKESFDGPGVLNG